MGPPLGLALLFHHTMFPRQAKHLTINLLSLHLQMACTPTYRIALEVANGAHDAVGAIVRIDATPNTLDPLRLALVLPDNPSKDGLPEFAKTLIIVFAAVSNFKRRLVDAGQEVKPVVNKSRVALDPHSKVAPDAEFASSLFKGLHEAIPKPAHSLDGPFGTTI